MRQSHTANSGAKLTICALRKLSLGERSESLPSVQSAEIRKTPMQEKTKAETRRRALETHR